MMGVGFAAAFALSLSSCISDAPPDPADAPIEIVATPAQCLLNRESVGTGTHEVVVIMEHGSGQVRILKDGAAVLTRPIKAQSDEPDQSSIELQQGRYVVECTVDGAMSTAQLTVTD
jgi:hypothetical protein